MYHKIFYLLFSLFFIFNLTSCDKDDPLSPAEDHFEAIGMVVYDATGMETLRILRGVTADTLFGEAGKRSDHYTVKFIDDKENIIDAPEDDPDHKFAWEIADKSVASIYQHPGEEGGFEFHIDGLKAGITSIEFFIEHEGHSDYRTGKIPLQIK